MLLAFLLSAILFQTPAATVQAESMVVVAGSVEPTDVRIYGANGGPATITGSVVVPASATYNVVVVARGEPLGRHLPGSCRAD
jgi:hypothetical protein